MNSRRWIVAGGVLGCASVALGAFGAHGLPDRLVADGWGSEQITRRIELFQTAARYQIYAAIVLLFLGLFARQTMSRLIGAAAWCMLVGNCVFSGLLYTMTFAGEDWNWLGAVVPIGGVLMIISWALIAVAGWRENPSHGA